jgi:hypothetical protein
MRLHGKHGAIGISANTSPSGSPADGDLVVVGALRSWSLAFDRAPIESTSLRSVARTYLPTLVGISGGFEGTFDTDDIQILTSATTDQDAVWVRITPSTEFPELFFQGSAWVTLGMAGAASEAVTVSASFTGNGAWQSSFDA